MVVALSVTGDTPDGPPPDPKDRQLRLPKAVLYRARFLIYELPVDARASNDANVCHGPSHVAVNLAVTVLVRPRSYVSSPYATFLVLVPCLALWRGSQLLGIDLYVTSHDGVTPSLIMAYKPLVRSRFRT